MSTLLRNTINRYRKNQMSIYRWVTDYLHLTGKPFSDGGAKRIVAIMVELQKLEIK